MKNSITYFSQAFNQKVNRNKSQKNNLISKQGVAEPISLWAMFRHYIGEIKFPIFINNASSKQDLINQAVNGRNIKSGEVVLIGSGPGDAGLLTLHALALLQQADVVVHDRLVSQQVLDLIPINTRLIHVGKRASFHSLPQDKINQTLIELAQQKLKVVRLKGGDNFIFGRGGEELQDLVKAGISFQVVPGITAASGCTTYAGIPLTHRDYAQSVAFVTGYAKEGGIEADWQRLANSKQTLVVYMAKPNAVKIEQALIKHGLKSNTSIALIENGTLKSQRVVKGQLNQLSALAEQVNSPAIVIIGDVVKLSDDLNWFNTDRELKHEVEAELVN
ncbi:uroporphyrinogen-III C-methyltransferase [Vibrio sp. SS-MA-C1-2]|uniref:uroporphyrinogen-III C-methyltransferase n=1 Tax=Vibrio sp. SS-MA-C1-2 TaxID=2908646 RepID=UPI001F3B203B|nr:uroporphyrinogen-III C-methyltransferase [Vibrio sp. SS-MA-C1-2]UJF18003.1 uroporphyrinogen-III C-methyltransferase [Vibrio sp. SS-MA-C1-2]